jgi:hypothetical protein
LLQHPANDFVRQFLGHQQLALTLKALPLKGLWSHLSDAPAQVNYALHSRQSIWEAMEWLAQHPGRLAVFDVESQTGKYIGFSDLEPVFQNPAQ